MVAPRRRRERTRRLLNVCLDSLVLMFALGTKILDSLDYWSVALLMLLENLFPPIPSEVVMPAAGYAARDGGLSFVGVVCAGTIGAVAGTTPWYLVGRWWGEERLYRWLDRHGRWIAVRSSEAERAVDWFTRRGGAAVLIGRWAPGFRTLVSVPAGFARMPLGKFLAYSTAGSAVWNVALAWLGWALREHYKDVAGSVGWIGTAVVVGFVGWWLARLTRAHGWLGVRSRSSDSS